MTRASQNCTPNAITLHIALTTKTTAVCCLHEQISKIRTEMQIPPLSIATTSGREKLSKDELSTIAVSHIARDILPNLKKLIIKSKITNPAYNVLNSVSTFWYQGNQSR